MPLIEEYTSKLREKVLFYLINGETQLLNNDSKYPFGTKELPIMCNFAEEEPRKSSQAYQSSYRSVVFLRNSRWFKAKGIGIPAGNSRPIFHNGKILSYCLLKPRIGTGEPLIWGFSTCEDAEKEVFWMKVIKEQNLSEVDSVGTGIYKDILVLDFDDRIGLFRYLDSTDLKNVLEHFLQRSRQTTACCVFCYEPSDIRVDEILYAFMFPKVEKVVDKSDCKDYVKWLGSSCAYNLRQFHNHGLLHGTILKRGGFFTNSHFCNHLVGETKTWMTDFHMVEKTTDRLRMRREVWCLLHVMNPLEPTIETAPFSRFPFELLDQRTPMGSVGSPAESVFSFISQLQIPAGHFEPTLRSKFQEELAMELKEGVESGYEEDIFDVESEVKKEMLRKIVQIKETMWKLYNLPKSVQRGIDYIQKTIRGGSIPKKEFGHILRTLQES